MQFGPRRPRSTFAVAVCVLVGAAVAVSGIVAARSHPGGSELGLGASVGIRLIGIFVLYGLLGGALVALGPNYANETVSDIRNDPGGAFGWGILVGIIVPIALALLAITIVGLVVTIPGLIVVAIVGLIGNAVSIVWVGTLVSRGGGDRVGGKSVGFGALALAVIGSIPVLGDVVLNLVSFFGIGVVGRRIYVSWQG